MIPADLRTALRSLRATPGLTFVAFGLLAAGIAACTIVFSVVDTVVFRRLPFDEPDRLVSISTPLSRNLASGIQVAGQDFFAWRERQDVLSGLAAVTFSPALTVKDAPGSAPIQAKSVTADVFDVLRVTPALGRAFTWDNEVTGRERVALIGYDLWQRQFGGDPSVVGRTVEFTRGAFEIVGVMPRGFTYPVGLAQPVEMWVPWVPRPNDRLPDFPGRAWMLEVVGRLKDGVTLDQARTRMGQIHATLQTQSPTFLTERAIVTTSLADALIGSVRPWMLLLLTAVGVLLLITCVNVANLLLARSITRQRDGAIRTALGATRGRLVRVMLIESAWLATAATIAGVLLAVWGVTLAKANLPAGIPRATAIAIDFRVLLIAAAAGAATAMLIGLLPALRSSGGDLASLLGSATRSQTGAGTRWRAALIVGEIALVVTILVGSGLVLLSFVRLVTLDLGMNVERVTAFDVRVPTLKIEPTNQWMPPLDHVRMTDLFGRLRAVPGVQAVALITDGVPLAAGGASYSIEVPGRGKFDGPDAANHHGVSGGYFAAMHIPVLHGREFDDTDVDNSAPVIMINDTAARRYFGVANPVGQADALCGRSHGRRRRRQRTHARTGSRRLSGVLHAAHPGGERLPDIARARRRTSWQPRAGHPGGHRARAAEPAAGPAHPVARRSLPRPHRAPPVHDVGDDDGRRGRARAGDSRHLWRHDQHRRAADARDRRADGARRVARRRAAIGRRPRTRVRARRIRDRSRAGMDARARSSRACSSVWRRTIRSCTCR